MEGDLWAEIRETQRLLELALSEAKQRGEAMVLAEAAYYTAKAQASFELKEQGVPVTFIQTVIKGVPEVCEPMTRYHAAQVEYENAREARQVYKKRLDTRICMLLEAMELSSGVLAKRQKQFEPHTRISKRTYRGSDHMFMGTHSDTQMNRRRR